MNITRFTVDDVADVTSDLLQTQQLENSSLSEGIVPTQEGNTPLCSTAISPDCNNHII